MRRVFIIFFAAALILGALDNMVYAYNLKGNVVSSDDGALTVWPAHQYNPSLQWTYINISVGSKDDYKFINEFSKDVDKFILQEQGFYDYKYKSCDDLGACEDITQSIYGWVDVENEKKHDNKFKLSSKAYKEIDGYKLYRFKYTPSDNSGKYDITLENKNKDIISVLDPWYSQNQNITTGFVRLTSRSFEETAEYYTEGFKEDFANLSRLTISQDLDAPATLTTTRYIHGGSAANVSTDITASGGEETRVEIEYNALGEFPVIDATTADYCGVWYYLNDVSGITNFMVTFGSTNSHLNDIINYSQTTHSKGWNYLEMDLNNPQYSLGAYSGTAWSVWFRIHNDNSADFETILDYFHCYNNTPTARWTPASDNEGNFSLISTNNGFGFNTTALIIPRLLNSSVYDKLYLDISAYDNLEVIWKMKQQAQGSSDFCTGAAWANEAGGSRYIGFYNQKVFTRDDVGNSHYADGITQALDTWVYFKIVINNSLAQHFYAYNLTHPEQKWTLADNYTISASSYDYFVLRARLAQCVYDNILIREIVTEDYDGGNYHSSFIYDSANATTWAQYDQVFYRDGAILSNTTYYYPNNLNQTQATPLTYGLYQSRVYVYDTAGNMAENLSINTVDAGRYALNLTFLDETTGASLSGINVTFDIIGDNFSATYSTTTGYYTMSNITIDDYVIKYDAPGYDPREYYLTIIYNATVSANLYLLNSTLSDRVIHTVYDQHGDELPNITIKLQRYYTTTNSYITVSMITSNFEGDAALYVELYDVYYKMIYEDADGNTIKITDPSPFFLTETTDTINTEDDTFSSWRVYDNVLTNLTFVNASGTIYARFFFSDSNNLLREACLNVQRITTSDIITICDNCTASSSATLTCVIDPTADGQYKAVGLIDTNSTGSWYPANVLYRVFTQGGRPDLLGSGAFLAAVFVGTVTLMGVASVTGSVVFMVVAIVAIAVTQLVLGLTMGYIWYLLILGLIVVFLVRWSQK